jgi:hypothetical protein
MIGSGRRIDGGAGLAIKGHEFPRCTFQNGRAAGVDYLVVMRCGLHDILQNPSGARIGESLFGRMALLLSMPKGRKPCIDKHL